MTSFSPDKRMLANTCGFEILLSQESSLNIQSENPRGRFWEQYLSSLKKNGFFQDQLEGSKKYKELFEKAKTQFKDDFDGAKNTSPSSSKVIETISNLIKESKFHREEISKLCENIEPEDDDEWMTITPEELDEMMLKNWSSISTNETPGQEEIDNLTRMVSSMRSFVDNVSSYEGAEVPGEPSNSSNTETRQCNKQNQNDDGGDDREIDFDSNEFMACVKELLDDPLATHEISSENESDIDYDDLTTCNEVRNIENDEYNFTMQQMDDELNEYSVRQTFKNDNDEPFDADVNLIKNFLESFSSQQGLSGPVSNMLQSMGMMLPPDDPKT